MKPRLHACGSYARAFLRPIAFGRMWTWELRVKPRYGGEPVIVVVCPWCGRKLPSRLIAEGEERAP